MQTVVIDHPLEAGEQILAIMRQLLKQHEVLTIDLMGPPGSGKTELIEASARHLKGQRRVGVMVGALPTAQTIAQRLSASCEQVVQLNFEGPFDLNASHVYQALQRLEISALDALFIERRNSDGSLPSVDLGQDRKVALVRTAQALKPDAQTLELVRHCHVLLLNSIGDPLGHEAEAQKLLDRLANWNPAAKIIELTHFDEDHMVAWLKWLREEILFKKVESLMMR
jgi:hydrogenase nickel incorporation protein HypB